MAIRAPSGYPNHERNEGGIALRRTSIAIAIVAGLTGVALSGCVDGGPPMHRGPGPIINPPMGDHHDRRPPNRWDNNDRRDHDGRNDWNNRNDRHDRNDRDRHDSNRRDDCKPAKWNNYCRSDWNKRP